MNVWMNACICILVVSIALWFLTRTLGEGISVAERVMRFWVDFETWKMLQAKEIPQEEAQQDG